MMSAQVGAKGTLKVILCASKRQDELYKRFCRLFAKSSPLLAKAAWLVHQWKELSETVLISDLVT